jgi:hypothetical protein
MVDYAMLFLIISLLCFGISELGSVSSSSVFWVCVGRLSYLWPCSDSPGVESVYTSAWIDNGRRKKLKKLRCHCHKKEE